MNLSIRLLSFLLLLLPLAVGAQVPQLINYQGCVAAGGVAFDGPGQFKFALVDAAGTISYWSNDGTSNAGSEPAAAVILAVSHGSYSVLLGDASLPNMTAVPEKVLAAAGLQLRVWFNDGTNGSQLLSPDAAIAAPAIPLPGNVHQPRDAGAGSPADTGTWQNRAGGSAPVARHFHTSVWTGGEMIVWGGYDGTSDLNDGARYNPAANSWTAVSPAGAPSARSGHTAVWTGSGMIVWGGNSGNNLFSDGGRYLPATNSWTVVTATGAPAARASHTAIWTGSEMIVWGGSGSATYNSGGRYNPETDSWTAMSTSNAPAERYNHTAVWTGSQMIVWGGIGASYTNGTFSYTPDSDDSFRITSIVRSGPGLVISFPSSAGRTYTLWRSDTLAAGSWINAGVAALTGNGSALSFNVPAPTPPARRFFRVQSGQ